VRRSLSSDEEAFERKVERFLADSLPSTISDKIARGASVDRAELLTWTRILDDRGWAAPHWPVEYGGTGWSLVERHLFDMACRAAHAPPLSGFGFNMVGPAIIRYGSADQQARFLAPTRRGDLWWCQGYSEAQAGSDLASLRTRAVRDGDEYVVNGQKIWTSGAEVADWIFCLVRTNSDVRAQRGISFLLIDLSTPGIGVEPLIAFNGKRLWNQVFLTDVRVPVGNRLGEEDRGWSVAKTLLGDERLMVARVAENRRLLARVREVAGNQPDGEHPVGASHAIRSKIAHLDIRLRALEATSLRLLTAVDQGLQVGAEPSMLKLRGSMLVQAFDELLFEIAGLLGLPQDGTASAPADGTGELEYVASGMFHHRGYTIAGGSSEIQRNIIAKEALGL